MNAPIILLRIHHSKLVEFANSPGGRDLLCWTFNMLDIVSFTNKKNWFSPPTFQLDTVGFISVTQQYMKDRC